MLRNDRSIYSSRGCVMLLLVYVTISILVSHVFHGKRVSPVSVVLLLGYYLIVSHVLRGKRVGLGISRPGVVTSGLNSP